MIRAARQNFLTCPEPSRTVPYQSELPHTIRMVRVNFNEFLRIDSGRRFVEIRLLLDRGIRNKFRHNLRMPSCLRTSRYEPNKLLRINTYVFCTIRIKIRTVRISSQIK